jgi:hypothetical protein
MKKALNRLLNAAMIVIVAMTAAPLVLGMLFFILLFILSKTGMLDGLPCSEAAIAALDATHLSACAEYTPCHAATVDDYMTLFELSKYDNHVDHTDLRAELLSLAAATNGWHVKALSPAEYAARIPAEAAFLLPDATFDAWFESAEDMAFFDQETGLFIRLRKGETPKPGSVRANGLTVPYAGCLYEMETHGGFHGDGSTYYALIVPENQRPALEKAIAAHADWHRGSVTHAEYRVLHDKLFFQVLPLYPAADVAFEWCSFADTYARRYPDEPPCMDPDSRFPAAMQELGACWSMNWLCALYDPDTGLFIYYQYDS